jgi:hypothetical protein
MIKCSNAKTGAAARKDRAPFLRLLRTVVAILPAMPVSAVAFDDKLFCVAAQQLAIAVSKDVGNWMDRVTRNAGMAVACDSRIVEFTRFAYIVSASMTDHWKSDKASEWNASQCSSRLWKEAIGNGWSILLSIAAADGSRATFKAQCR